MGRRSIPLCVIGLGLVCALQAWPADPAPANGEQETYGRTPRELVPYGKAGEPYRRFYQDAPVSRGPGREAPDPTGLETVRIGLLAPLENSARVDAGRNLKRGVELALAEANASGGYRGTPFELVSKNDQVLWGASSNTLVELAYVDRVWAMIGSINSNSTHVALRAALKSELLIVNVGSADPTVTETGIPWIVRLTPDDRQAGYRLAHLVFEEWGLNRVAVVRSTDRYGRFGVKEFRDGARRLARPLPMELLIRPGQANLDAQLERLEGSGAEAVVLWLDGDDAGRVVRWMGEHGIALPVAGPDRLVSDSFLAEAGTAAEGVTATAWFDPGRSDPMWVGFRERYAASHDSAPDAYATYGYDAARLVVDVIRSAGLNRIRIRDALTAIRAYHGVAGPMQFDATSNNVAPLVLGRVERGRFVFR